MAEQLMTEEQYFAQVRQWADKVRAQARANAAAFQKGKKKAHTYVKGSYHGQTEYKLSSKVGYVLRKRYGDLERVLFKFPVHGIFREYGVGNGQPRHGVAVKSGKVASARTYIKRSMSDWMHNPLEQNVEALADIATEYYGDKMLVEFKRLDAIQ